MATVYSFGQVITAEFEEAVEEVLQQVARDLERTINEVNQSFFHKFVSMTIGAPDTPEYADRDWVPLSRRWLAYKARKGMSLNFYRASGRLGAFLGSQSAQKRFGYPVATVIKGSGGIGSPGVRSDTFLNRGRSISRGRNALGRFAPKTSVYVPGVPWKIEVYPFPDMPSNPEMTFKGTKSLSKLRNPKGQQFRPSFNPYVDWWIRNTLVNAVRRVTG